MYKMDNVLFIGNEGNKLCVGENQQIYNSIEFAATAVRKASETEIKFIPTYLVAQSIIVLCN